MLCASVAWLPSLAHAKPVAPGIFCDQYPEAPACIGALPACTYCHTTPPERNRYGAQVAAALLPGQTRPLADADFINSLPGALRAVMNEDADGDGVSNFEEIGAGTLPADDLSVPKANACPGVKPNARWDVCEYDRRYVYKKLHLDFCGFSPSYAELEGFAALSTADQDTALDAALDRCLGTEFWRGRDGAVWRLAHRKIRPLQAIKSGRGAGVIPLGDYDADYALFVYANTGDRDVRDVLTADYFVTVQDNGLTEYTRQDDLGDQNVEKARRSGLLTSRWSLVYFVMFSALPRTAAAQAYRGFLNLDIAKLQGLNPVPGEPVDYDAKGVTAEACVVCHSTLDPLSYPFKNYTGLDDQPFAAYDAARMRRFRHESSRITMMPEQGFIFGQAVSTVPEWGRVAADSDAFARAVVEDYWKLAHGEPPTSDENAELEQLWKDLRGKHAYRLEPMLHDLIRTEAYGVP